MSAKYTFAAWEVRIKNNASLKLLLIQLGNNSNDDGFSFYSLDKMADNCGFSRSTAKRKILELESMGILTIKRRSNRPSIYRMNYTRMIELSTVKEAGGQIEPPTDLGGQNEPLGGVRVNHDPNNDPNSKKINKKDSTKTVDKPQKPPEPTPDNLDPKDPNFHTRYETEEQRHAEKHNARNISNTNFESPAPRQKCAAVIAAEKRKQDFEKNKDPKVEQEYLAELKRLSGLASDKKNE